METQCNITADSLLKLMGKTPADNQEGYTTCVPWKSKKVGEQMRKALLLKNSLKNISERPMMFGPMSYLANMQKIVLETYCTDTLQSHARASTRSGISPDIYVEENLEIENQYAALLSEMTGYFVKNGTFDQKEARRFASTPEGEVFLKKYVKAFSLLEGKYNSLGLTRLKALKELMVSLLLVITGRPLEKGEMPFMKNNKDGSSVAFSDYLESCRLRLEKLSQHDAFNIKAFSAKATGGKLGYCKFEIVPGSQLHTVTLRHYLLPKGVKANGKVIYLGSPLINMAEIYDLAADKSVIEGLLKEGYEVFLVDNGNPGDDETNLGLDFYGKTVHDNNLNLIKARCPGQEIFMMGYCMGGTLGLAYLARRAEELHAQGKEMDIKKVALMATPVKFDDEKSGHKHMRDVVRNDYNTILMKEMYGEVNIPPQIIEVGMHEIQPGVQYSVTKGFFERANYPGAIEDAAPFLYWLHHGTKFPSQAHYEWINHLFMDDQLFKGTYCMPSCLPELDGKPVNMGALKDSGVRIFDYRGLRDAIAPSGSCIASELWGQRHDSDIAETKNGLNRTIEKNIGHIFVVSKVLLSEYLHSVTHFFSDETWRDSK